MRQQSNCEQNVLDVLKAVNERKGELFSLTDVQELSSPGQKVKDGPGVYLVRGTSPANDAVLKFSNEQFPDHVSTAVNKMREARNLLPTALAQTMPTPIDEGRFRSRSFVIWPRYRPISNAKIPRAIQKRFLYDRLFSWLSEVGRATARRDLNEEQVEQACRKPLEFVCRTEALSRATRSVADNALQSLNRKTQRPVCVLQHADFYLGNILLPRRLSGGSANRFGFFVIDWGGSHVYGAPGFDLLMLCKSANVGRQRARREILNYTSALGISAETFVFETVVALGLIGLNLNEFPMQRYAALCDSCLDLLGTVGLMI